ncbi:unnamed protein product, partial [Allacma fusca]
MEVIVNATLCGSNTVNGYDVHSIYGLALSLNDKSFRYRVHWAGYSRFEDTWEPLENFSVYMLGDIMAFHRLVLEHCRLKHFSTDCSRIETMYLSYLQEPVLKDMLLSWAANGIHDLRPSKESTTVHSQTEHPLAKSMGTQTKCLETTSSSSPI